MRQLRSRAIAGIAIAIILFLSGARAGAFQGEPDGYDGMSWGTPLDSVTVSMEYAGTRGGTPDTVVYRRTGGGLMFGAAHLKAIEYGFTVGKLTVVTLKVDSLLQYLLMKEEALRRFGPGREADPRAERFIWEGGRTTIRLVSAFDMS
jgi:hypothetical protein